MRQPSFGRSAAALVLGATLLLTCLSRPATAAATPAAAPRVATAASAALPQGFERLWQSLVQLLHASPLAGWLGAPTSRGWPATAPGARPRSAPGRAPLPDSGCSLNPEGHCVS